MIRKTCSIDSTIQTNCIPSRAIHDHRASPSKQASWQAPAKKMRSLASASPSSPAHARSLPHPTSSNTQINFNSNPAYKVDYKGPIVLVAFSKQKSNMISRARLLEASIHRVSSSEHRSRKFRRGIQITRCKWILAMQLNRDKPMLCKIRLTNAC